MKIRSSKNRIISIAIAAAIISTCTIPNVIAESRNEINEPEQTISDLQEDEVYITGEIEELRSEYSKTYDQSDGSRIAVMSAAPVHFYDEKAEEWKEYDNRLTYNEETENYESEETGSDMQVLLPRNINEQNDIEVEADGYKVSITPIDMNSSSSKKTNEKKKIKSISEKSLKKYSLEDYVSDSVLNGKVEYTQDDSLKVEYIFSGSGLKENIILSEAPVKNQTYTFRIKADGLKAKLKKDNTIKLLDEERAYPVTIDPTVDTKDYTEKIVDTSVVSISSANIVSNYTLFVGSYSNYTVDSYIKFAKLPPSDKKWIISSGKLQYYEYVCGDGSTIYFYYNNIADKYIDMSGRGYTIKCKDKNKTGYDNLVVIDSGGKEYHFEKYGRLVKIIDTSVTSKPEIELKYDDDFSNFYHIEYITDGAGRKYKFNYSGIKLTDISYYGKKNTVIQKVSYEYDNNSNLTKVIYPDGKLVSYSWDNHNMISACNTDGYTVNFSYCKNPKRLSSIKEYGTAGTKGADISIEYTPYQTKYINNNTGDTETKVFNNSGNLISSFNSKGDVTLNEYSKNASGLNSLVNTYEHTVRDDNLLENGEFENGLQGWSISNETNTICDQTGHCGSDKAVKLIGEPNENCSISQSFGGMSIGETFEVGGWAKANASPQNPFNITVTFFNAAKVAAVHTIDFNPYCTDWQYVMKNFKMENFYTHFNVSINYSNQINEAYFDGIAVYRSKTEDNIINNDTGISSETGTEEVTEPLVSVGSDKKVTTTEEKDGIKTVSVVDKYENELSNETIVDGVSYKESKKYISSGNYLKSSEDSCGTKTSYDYDVNTGNLNSVNINYNYVNYDYDKNGNITSASQNVSKLNNGTLIQNSYCYDSGDRLSRITHNGFDYDLGYTEFGLIESIEAGKNKIINYSYDNDGVITELSYGNNQIIDYEYNNDKNKTSIKLNDKQLYNYKYDELGNLNSIEDNISGRVTNYLKNSDGQNVIEETGDNLYHKLDSSENKRIEVIDNKSKQTDINSEDYSTEIKYKISNSYYSHYFKNRDKFERISNESVYRDGKTTSTQVYNKAYNYYSPGANKTSERVNKLTFTGGYNKTFRYGYDAYGHISEINNIWYSYDEAGQLTTEADVTTGTGKDYIYDKGGNITEIRHFVNGVYGETDTFTYGDPNWKDLLTEYNGNEITYDEIGNPLTYYNGAKFTWTMGRRLESVKKGNARISYKYNADGQRTSKIINGIKFNYFWNGSKLTAQTWLGNIIYFYYDNNGVPIGFDYNNDHYYYITNLQGDIIAILSLNGELAAEYEYDAWGNYNIVSNKDGIANINPLRYRGYYYDSDTEMYYLQSRYYDSKIGRFINADDLNVLISLDGFDKKVLGLNLFSYANNNPISNRDSLGFVAVVDDVALAAVACILAIAGVASYTITRSTSASWSGGVISNSRQLDIASSTTVTVRTKATPISDALIRSQRITREKVNKADYLLATVVYYGSDKRGCSRNYIPIY